ncbi:MAG: phosphoribosylanthranilate isomerase [Alphaproteobacteria bacterium]|nr:phosphoribosylanthranilate isomerase [Alphaproteobacteria bacterium]MDE2351397.1 phosphoribosylanthranilate isomerase [Alphaproteobacteria bacterium]
MSTEVKICGVNAAEAVDAALSAKADYLGLVFFPRSPRHLMPAQAASLAARARGRARLVALLVDAGDEAIASAIAAARPDFLQLHGQETPERVGAVRAKFGLPVIKALAVAELADLVPVPMYEQAADMLLFDAKAPGSADRPGGHGAAFDWQLLKGRKFARPWLLAGGLNAGNVARAIAASGAPGVDTSSGVEAAPGKKSAELIREFVAAARGAQSAGQSTESTTGSAA